MYFSLPGCLSVCTSVCLFVDLNDCLPISCFLTLFFCLCLILFLSVSLFYYPFAFLISHNSSCLYAHFFLTSSSNLFLHLHFCFFYEYNFIHIVNGTQYYSFNNFNLSIQFLLTLKKKSKIRDFILPFIRNC